MSNTTRSMKVYSKFSRTGRKYRPQIRLEGDWLQNTGFYIGDSISVVCEDNRLIIEKSPDSTNATLTEDGSA